MICGAAELWEVSGLPEKRCAHPYCIPAPPYVHSEKNQHCSCASLQYSSTACTLSYHIRTLWDGRWNTFSQQASYPTLVRECDQLSNTREGVHLILQILHMVHRQHGLKEIKHMQYRSHKR